MSFKGISLDDSHICKVCASCRLFEECCIDSEVFFCPVAEHGLCSDCPVSSKERCTAFLPIGDPKCSCTNFT